MAQGNPIIQVFPYAQGPEGGLMEFLISVRNGSRGAEVSFHATEPNPAGPQIELPKTAVAGEEFMAGIQAFVPANYESNIVVSYFPNGTPVKPGFTLDLRVYFVPPDDRAPNVGAVVSDDPSLKLNVEIQNPMLSQASQVAVSTDAAYPVLNTLRLLIHNPSDNPVIPFENPDGLTPQDPLPPIDRSHFGPRLDRL